MQEGREIGIFSLHKPASVSADIYKLAWQAIKYRYHSRTNDRTATESGVS